MFWLTREGSPETRGSQGRCVCRVVVTIREGREGSAMVGHGQVVGCGVISQSGMCDGWWIGEAVR